MHPDHWLERLPRPKNFRWRKSGGGAKGQRLTYARREQEMVGETIYDDVVCMPNDLLFDVL